MDKYDIGWSDDWNHLVSENDLIARITVVHRGLCRALTEAGEVNVYLTGRFQLDDLHSAEMPATGDWVILNPPFIDQQDLPAATLKELLPRRTKLSRVGAGSKAYEQVIAANVDVAYIVTSANSDFSVNRVRRFVLLANNGGVIPVVLVTKSDLLSSEQKEKLENEIKSAFPDLEVSFVSSKTGEGVSQIVSTLKTGVTGVIIGSSGVGKSTLTNKILGADIQTVKTVREGDDKGRHTTTSRELFRTPSGGLIIDTAGIREVQVFGESESLYETFGPVAERAKNCKFSDCTHSNEPGCAILAGLKSGEISQSDLASYDQLLREMAYANRKINKKLASDEKKKWKKINVDMKVRMKLKGRD